jgi:putative ABC transport system permease protein
MASISAARARRGRLLLVGSRRSAGAEAAVRAIRRARPDLHPFSNAQFIDRFAATDFSYFQQMSFVLSTVTLFFAFLLVATLLTVSVNQRLGEVASLRALGFSRGRVALGLMLEAALLSGLGGLFALPIGIGLARILDTILRDMPHLPLRLHFFVLEPRAVLLQLDARPRRPRRGRLPGRDPSPDCLDASEIVS